MCFRSLRKVGPNFIVTEVFSKHKTLTEHVELLYTVCPIVVVGTIERIQKLVLYKTISAYVN
jgi:hypothetical protein